MSNFNAWDRQGGRHINSFTGENISHREYLKRGYSSTKHGIDGIKTKNQFENRFVSSEHVKSRTRNQTATFNAREVNSLGNVVRRLPETFKSATGFYARIVRGDYVRSTQVFGSGSVSEIAAQLKEIFSEYGFLGDSVQDGLQDMFLELIVRTLL